MQTTAELAFDLAKIDLAVDQARRGLGDDRLTMRDVGTLFAAARTFGVSVDAAYRRARGLGLLSWQAAQPDADALPAGSEEALRRMDLIEAHAAQAARTTMTAGEAS